MSNWEPAAFLPSEISAIVTDHIGNPEPDYAGTLQFRTLSVLDMLDRHSLFAAFRAVGDTYLEYIGEVPPTAAYNRLRDRLIHVGWDVCTGNGWLSASVHGCFPINGITGEVDETKSSQVNNWGLLHSFEDVTIGCSINNVDIPGHSPWYPVEVLVDEGSYGRLSILAT